MGRDKYDDRDEYHTGAATSPDSRPAGGRDMHRQERSAEGSGRRDAMGGKSRSSHNWPPRSKYRIRPWG